MEESNVLRPKRIIEERGNIIESKEYEIEMNKEKYILIIEKYKNKLNFRLRKKEKMILIEYNKEYEYEDMIKELLLDKEYYNEIDKIYKLYENLIEKGKVSIMKIEGIMKLIIKKENNNEEIELKENIINNNEMIRMIYEEMREMEKRNDEKVKRVEEKMEKMRKEMDERIENIIEERSREKEEMRKKIDEIKEENKKMKEKLERIEKEKEDKREIFKKNPENLKFNESLTNNHRGYGNLCNFDVYIGLKDNIEYIVYNNKNNYNIEIMRINDKVIINSLKGHNIYTYVIRYYKKDNKEEYILSCDKNRLIIIWDIQNNYNKKYILQIKDSGDIWDALLLFNNLNNYIIVPSYNKNEFSKLYEFKENTPFIRNIYGTNENETNFMIPWIYNNKYYIIECCYKKISINNIFENECYANLIKDPEGYHCCGYIYNDNYLCVSDSDNNFIRIWDLVNKNIYKEIKYDANKGCEIIPWNNKYTIIGCEDCFVIIDIEEGKMIKKIKLDYVYVQGVKKMKISKLGECLITSDSGEKIRLYNI